MGGYYDVFGWVDKFKRQGVSLGEKKAEQNKNDICFFVRTLQKETRKTMEEESIYAFVKVHPKPW